MFDRECRNAGNRVTGKGDPRGSIVDYKISMATMEGNVLKDVSDEYAIGSKEWIGGDGRGRMGEKGKTGVSAL